MFKKLMITPYPKTPETKTRLKPFSVFRTYLFPLLNSMLWMLQVQGGEGLERFPRLNPQAASTSTKVQPHYLHAWTYGQTIMCIHSANILVSYIQATSTSMKVQPHYLHA